MDEKGRESRISALRPPAAPMAAVVAVWLGIDLSQSWSALSGEAAVSVLLQIIFISAAVGTIAGLLIWGLLRLTFWLADRLDAEGTPWRVFLASSVVGLLALVPMASTVAVISEGAWIREQSWLPVARFAVLGGGVAIITLVWGLALRTLRGPIRSRGLAGVAIGLLSVALLVADQVILVGRQESFHLLLSAAGLLCIALATQVMSLTSRRNSGSEIALVVWGIGLTSVALIAFGVLPLENPAARDVLFNEAPLTGRLLRRLQPPEDSPLNADSDFLKQLQVSTRVAPALLDERFPLRRDANLIIITVDTLRADAVGLHGNTMGLTPNIDAFGAESVVFDNAYTQHPSSQLAMASMFKGLYPLATDVYASLEPRFFGRRPKPHQPMLAERLRDAGRETAAVTAFGEGIFRVLFSYLADGFDRCNDYPHPKTLDGSEVEAHAIRELNRLGSRPYYLWVHLFDPHDPYDPPVVVPGSSMRDRYNAEIVQADACLGRILNAARKRDDWDRTVVIIHSDHGEEFREHGGRHHHSTLYEEQARVPLLIRFPGQPAMRVEQPVELMDIPETMFDFMGIKPAAYGHGQSLMPLVLTDIQHSALPAPIAFSQFHAPGQRISRLDSVRVGDWKLIHDLISGTDALFDLDADPGERRNLSHTNPSQLAFMRRWLDTCSAVVRDESGEVDIVDLPDDAILAALEKLDATAVQTAIGRLIVAGRVEPLLPFLTRFITAGVGLKRCQLALRYVAAAGYEPALPQIIALLSEQPDFEKAAALALGHYHGDVIVTALQARIAYHGNGAPWWLQVAVGLQGVSSAEAPLIAFVPHIEDADAEYYRALALAVLRVDRGDPTDTGILETVGLKRDLQMVGLSVSSRFPADDLLPGVYDAVRRTTIPFEVLTRLIETLRHYPLQAVAPIYRALADQHDPSVRDRAKAEIAALETLLKDDWGTVTKEFWDDAAKGRVGTRAPKDVGVHLTRYQERLRSFRKNLMQPALLKLSSARDLPTSLRVGTLFALPLTVACSADGGAALGGAADSALLFQVSLGRSGKPGSQSITNFRLPIAGLLPGESTHCLPLIRVPAVPLGPGYEVVIRARAAAPFAVNCDELVFAVTIR